MNEIYKLLLKVFFKMNSKKMTLRKCKIIFKVSLNLEKSNLDSSSGVFVLYNYARVCTILRKHHDLVQSGEWLSVQQFYSFQHHY